MDVASFIFFAGVIVFAAHFFAWLFSYTNIPDVLLLIVVGIVLGPVFGFITPDFFGQTGAVFSSIVLAIMLFHSGSLLRLDTIRMAFANTLSLTVVNFFVSMLAIGCILWVVTDLGPILSFMIGAMAGGTSSVIVIPLARALKMSSQGEAIALLESASTDILSIIVTIALFSAYQSGVFHVTYVARDIVVSFVGALFLGGFAGAMWSVVLRRVRLVHNPIFLTPAFVFVLYGVAETIGVSGPITALVFGIMMGNSAFFERYVQQKHRIVHLFLCPEPLSQAERSFFNELVFILQTFFFVFVGISISFAGGAGLYAALIITAVVFIIRIPIVKATVSRSVPVLDRAQLAAMVPKGMATAVLATYVASRGVAHAELIQHISYMIILSSVVVTSCLVFLLHITGLRRVYERAVGW